MQRLPLKFLKPGMTVAKPVLNEKGMPLVSENTALTEKLIERLDNLNVTKVAVRGFPVKSARFTPKALKDKLADLEIGFSKIPASDDLMKKYKVLLRAHFMKRDKEINETG